MTTKSTNQTANSTKEQKRDSGMPGGGQGRTDKVGDSGVYPASGPWPAGDAPFRGMGEWGQGERGASGYQEHGDSELNLGPSALGKPPQQCRDLMSKNPVYSLPSDPVEKAAQLMKTENIGSLPVVADAQTKKLVGIVTDRDLALQIVAGGRNAQRTKVEEVMTRNLVTSQPEDDLQQVLWAMAQHQVRRIPVVTANGELVGIVAQADIATRLEEPQQTAAVVEEISQPEVR